MSIDTVILSIMRVREEYDKLYNFLPKHSFDEKTQTILVDFGKYFQEFDHKEIDPATFETWFFTFAHPTLKDEKKGFYQKLLSQVHVPVNEETRKGIVARILELEYATKVANMVKEYDSGADIDIQRSIEEASETLKVQLNKRTKVPWVNIPIEQLLDEQGVTDGLMWRLQCLNESMRPLRPGDFGIVAGRPDTGKTTFLTDQMTFMAAQIAKFYKDEERYILWFNTEGPGKRIITRLYQSALKKSITDLLLMKKDKTIVPEYIKAVGSIDRIKIMDVHESWNYDIVDILNEVNPGLILFDMIDNIKFHTGAGVANSRTDQVLEGMYQWARVLGVRYDCPVLATSQISAEGDGLQYPTLSMLKDSKTGKQGTCDFQLMIGKSNEAGMENSRFIGLPKNKLHVEGFAKDPRKEVIFDGLRGRYITPEVS